MSDEGKIETEALKPSDLANMIIVTTVQPKDSKRRNRAREWFVRLAKRHAVTLHQSDSRMGKLAHVQQQR